MPKSDAVESAASDVSSIVSNEAIGKMAAHERLTLILICQELSETGKAGYFADEDIRVLNLANVLYRYAGLRAILQDRGFNTLCEAYPAALASV